MWRAKDPKTVVDELEFIVSEFDPEKVVFVDANFFVSRKRVEEICLLLREKRFNLKFQVSCCQWYNKSGTPALSMITNLDPISLGHQLLVFATGRNSRDHTSAA